MSDTTGVLSEAGTTYHSRAPEATRICCMLLFFALSYHMSLRTKFLVMSVAVSAWKRCPLRFPGRVCIVLFVGGLVYCLLCLCLFTGSSVRCMLCFVFVFVFFVLCTLCCQILWIVHF